MTIAIAHAGEGTNGTGSGGTTQWSFQVGASFAVYDYVIVSIASDNAGVGGADSVSSVQDSKGNVYSLIGQKLKSNAAAVNDSGSCRVYASQVKTALVATDLIFINQTPATNRGAAVIHKVTVAANAYVTFPIVFTDDGFSTGLGSRDLGTPAVGDGLITSMAGEYNDNPATIDTDSTGGPVWCNPTHYSIDNSGATTSSQVIACQHKANFTSAVLQQYTTAFAASCDWEFVAIFLREAIASAPSAPNAPSVSPSAAGAFTLDWNDVATPAGGRVVTSYEYRYSTDNATWSGAVNVGATSNGSISGLANGTLYYFQARAINAIGPSAWSASGTGTTYSVTAAPNAPTVTPAGAGSFNLDWNDVAPSASGHAVTNYKYRYSTDNSTWSAPVSLGSTTSAATVSGFNPATLYYFQIAAVNAIGDSAWSSSGSGTSATLPGNVTGLTASNNGDGTFLLSWTAPSNGGSAITDYLVEWSLKGVGSWTAWSHSALGAVTSCNVTGLNPATSYDFRIKAINAIGQSAAYSNVASADGRARGFWGVALNT